MINRFNTYPSIQICSLENARETDHSIYDGVITIEDSLEDNPLRINNELCLQLVLCFDDISIPVDDYILPQKKHIEKALDFADSIGNGSLIIHCVAGISRSSAIALAIIAKSLGIGKEDQAIKELQILNPYCLPNKLVVKLADEILGHEMKLYNSTIELIDYHY
tara:strand:- start:51 stop:542 length:492 start_codon:yes stop_codon:yes gene_type:complete